MSVNNELRVKALTAAVNEFNNLPLKQINIHDKALHPTMEAYLDAIGNDKIAVAMILDDTKPSINTLFTQLDFEIPKNTRGKNQEEQLKVLQVIENHLYNNYKPDESQKKPINIDEIKLSGGRRRLPRKSAKRHSNRRRSNRRRRTARK